MSRRIQVVPPFILAASLIATLLVCRMAEAQTQIQPEGVVTFALDFPSSEPQRYEILVPANGLAHYRSSAGGSRYGDLEATNDAEASDSFDLDFSLTAGVRGKIFDLAAKAGYFKPDPDFHRKHVAFTGKKTLTYEDGVRRGTCTYNYSENPAIRELTGLMQSLSETLEFGHRLQYDRRYQKLALDEELKNMEKLASTNELVEVTAIQPILEQIIGDSGVMNVTRGRAQRLLDRPGSH